MVTDIDLRRPTDGELSDQWMAALDQAERYGKQMAWLKSDETFEWANEFAVHAAWSDFINQFDLQTHHLLRQAFQSGYVQIWMAIHLARLG